MAGAHEGAAWDELLAHGRFVRSLARALVADASLADDVVQGTWLAAAAHPPADRERVAGWLRRVTTNVALKLRRGESRRERFERAAASRESLPPTDAAVERLEAQRDVIDAVRALDEKYRTVIVLRFFEELSAREIAKRLAMPVASVRTRLQRAVELLREKLTERNGGDERRWLAALAPLAWPHAAAGVGAIAWTAGAIAVAAAVAMVGSLHGIWRGGADATAAAGIPVARQEAPRDAAAARSPESGNAARADLVTKPSSDRDGVVVDGCVVNAIGKPVAGVEVAWQDTGGRFDHGEAWPTTDSTFTDREGRFAFRGLDLTTGAVRARKTGFVAVREWCELSFNQRRRRGLTLVLHEARSLHGTVVDENGRPVAGAWVYGFTPSRIDFDFPSARTDGNGAFALEGLPLSDIHVTAFAPGFRPDCSDPIKRGVDEVALRLRSEARTRLELTVVDPSGRPVRGAVSSFTYSGPPPSESSCYRSPPAFERRAIPESGLLVRDDLPAGKYMFRALWSIGQFDTSGVEVELRAGETTTARIEALAAVEMPRIHGRLVLVDGTPIGNERVAVARRDIDMPNLATTDAQGTFAFESPAPIGSSVLFWLMGPSLALVKPDGKGGIATAVVASDRAVDLVAGPTAHLAGRVVDEAGTPVVGASLELHGETRISHERIASTSSGSDGRFEFEALAPQPAPAELVAELGPMKATAPERISITAGAAIENVTLILPRAASIEGKVIDASGRPLAGVVVGPLRENAHPFAMTAADGRFRISGLSAGDHELCVAGGDDLFPRETSPKFPIRLAPGERRADFELRVPAPGPMAGTIFGRVVRSDGRLVNDRRLCVVLTDGSGGANFQGSMNEFEFHSLKPGTYGVRAYVLGEASLKDARPPWFILSAPTEATPGGAAVTLVLPEFADTGAIHAVFSAGAGRKAPSKFEWMLHPISSTDPEGKSGFGAEALLNDGELDLRGFPPGDFRVEIEFESGQRFERVVSFLGNETVELGAIDLDVSTHRHGFVVDSSGAALQGVLVSPQRTSALRLGTREDFLPDARNSETCESASDGSFDVSLVRGSLLFFKPGYAPLTWFKPPHETSSDAVLHITLLAAGQLGFEDIPSDLKSRGVHVGLHWLAAATARAGYETTQAMGGRSPFDDKYVIYNLPVGEYEVWIWTSREAGLTLNSDLKPPSADEPGLAHHWQIRIDAGATTRIDVAKEW